MSIPGSNASCIAAWAPGRLATKANFDAFELDVNPNPRRPSAKERASGAAAGTRFRIQTAPGDRGASHWEASSWPSLHRWPRLFGQLTTDSVASGLRAARSACWQHGDPGLLQGGRPVGAWPIGHEASLQPSRCAGTSRCVSMRRVAPMGASHRPASPHPHPRAQCSRPPDRSERWRRASLRMEGLAGWSRPGARRGRCARAPADRSSTGVRISLGRRAIRCPRPPQWMWRARMLQQPNRPLAHCPSTTCHAAPHHAQHHSL